MTRKKAQTLAAEVGSRLRHIRKHNGWTQKELADRLGVTVAQVSRWESGKILQNTDTQLDICDAWGVTMDLLIRGIGAGRGGLDIHVELRELCRIIEQLDIQYRNEACEVLRSIIAKARQDGASIVRAEPGPTPKARRR